MKYTPEEVYDELIGVGENQISEVECLFVDDEYPMQCYGRMLDAYRRLRVRLGVRDDDRDVECIINEFLEMQRCVGNKM